ncbi:hypothetical protein like AT5G13970 [Hibiscus trionum]|uniref:Protein TSSC4 n=1 Tax=Hibiscus trionum TaxID=183268 RepID=A0A9W7JCW3_HIBTR|nr:hypothetical protein like AT5G13970 [Hibiscus trionum]
MDDSFKLRVQKIFGSLQSSHSSSQPQQRSPLWSLSDEEVERRKWRRESAADREDTLCSSSFDEFLKEERKYRSGRRKELEDDLDNDDVDNEDDRGSNQSRSREIDEYGDELEIRSYIGMDSTLDNEEEEDQYDKVAAGRENAGERLYMSDIADHGSFLNSHYILQRALNRTSSKDHRANHMAAKIRLKEDDEGQKVNYCDRSESENRESSDVKASDNGCHLRSILKRKDIGMGFKPQKRVRFDCAYKNDLEEQFEKSEDHHSEDPDDVSLPAEHAMSLPDYLRNPSRYTRYSFGSSSEVSEESNAQTSENVLKLDPSSKSTESLSEHGDAPRDLPKSVTFIPKRKPGNLQLQSGIRDLQEKEYECKKSLHPTRPPVGIAAGAAEDGEDDATEEATPETSAANGTPVIQKGGRSYRVKSQPLNLDSF